MGRRAIGIDLNCIGYNACLAKTTFCPSGDLDHWHDRFVDKLGQVYDFAGVQGRELLVRPLPELASLESRFQALRKWYHEKTFYQLLLIYHVVSQFERPFRNLLMNSFSHIQKRVCSQKNHWGYIADNVSPKELVYEDPTGPMLDHLSFCIEALKDFPGSILGGTVSPDELNRRVEIHHADVTCQSICLEGSVDLVVTSPPYLNVTDYTMSQRLSLGWLLRDYKSDRKQEIGARWKRFRKQAGQEYVDQMKASFTKLARSIREGGYLCLVLDDITRTSDKLSLMDMVDACLSREYLTTVAVTAPRNLSRQRLRDREGTQSCERIAVYRR